MAANASFAGGNLTGSVLVPQSVLDQLADRAAAYPVPWTADDEAVSWLAPHRLLLYLDLGMGNVGQGALGQFAAWLGGDTPTPVAVLPVWSCRSWQLAQCFSGFWMDLSAAVSSGALAPGVPTQLIITFPPLAHGVFGGVVYENVDTVDTAIVDTASA